MKLNPETSKIDRFRLVLGTIISFVGVFTLLIVGAFYGYGNLVVWVVGITLILTGLLLAGSMRLLALIQDITRF